MCCVRPIAQQQMVRSERIAISAASRICSRAMPLLLDQLIPIGAAQIGDELVEASGVLADKIVIEDRAGTARLPLRASLS